MSLFHPSTIDSRVRDSHFLSRFLPCYSKFVWKIPTRPSRKIPSPIETPRRIFHAGTRNFSECRNIALEFVYEQRAVLNGKPQPKLSRAIAILCPMNQTALYCIALFPTARFILRECYFVYLTLLTLRPPIPRRPVDLSG